jgi:cytoskeletal protein RodZ
MDDDAAYVDMSFPFVEGKKVIIFGQIREDNIYYTMAGLGSAYEGDEGYAVRLDHANTQNAATPPNVPPTADSTTTAADTPTSVEIVGSVDGNETGAEEAMPLPSETVVEVNDEAGDEGYVPPAPESTTNTAVETAPIPTPAPVQKSFLDVILDFFRALFIFG